jgi:hypothetical protein
MFSLLPAHIGKRVLLEGSVFVEALSRLYFRYSLYTREAVTSSSPMKDLPNDSQFIIGRENIELWQNVLLL